MGVQCYEFLEGIALKNHAYIYMLFFQHSIWGLCDYGFCNSIDYHWF